MGRSVRSAYMDIVNQRTLRDGLYQVTVAANEGVRQPPELDFGGLSTENYARNPVVMWAHDVVGRSPSGGLPIGRTLKLTKQPEGRMVAEFEFLSDDPFAQRVKNAWDKGFLQAASISWVPIESVPDGRGKWRDARSDLLEWSIVAVPADPDALREAHRRMLEVFLTSEGSGAVLSDEGPTHGGESLEPTRAPVDGVHLSQEGYEGLGRAIDLLEEAVRQVQPADAVEQSLREGHETAGEWPGEAEDDLAEVAALVGSLRARLGLQGP